MQRSITWVFVVALSAFLSNAAFAGTKIKIATVAPDGTTWMKVMKEMAQEVEKSTGGEVKLKFYPGGVMGDEGDVIRKMRFGQVHGGAFTGRGLGEVNRLIHKFKVFSGVHHDKQIMDATLPENVRVNVTMPPTSFLLRGKNAKELLIRL